MANSKSIAAAGNATSDAHSMGDETIDAQVIVKADNAGTPASGDELTVKILATVGDPDADPDSADEYTTTSHAKVVAVLDTNSEDPAISGPIGIPPALKGIKVYASNGASSNAIVASAQIREKAADGTITETQITWT